MINKLKQQNLLSFIEAQTGQKTYNVGTNTYRLKKCPICGSGDHFTINSKENYYTTFGNCGKGTIIDFYMSYKGLEQKEAIKELFKIFKLEPQQQQKKQPDINLTEIIKNLYPKSIGIDYFSKRLLDKYINEENFEENFDKIISDNLCILANMEDIPNQLKNLIPKQFKQLKKIMIIPVWEDKKIENLLLKDYENKSITLNLSGRPTKIFNIDYLKSDIKNIFVTEGIFDCLSFEMVDQKSISINSKNMIKKFVELVKENIDQCKDKNFIICFDNDRQGQEAKNELIKMLTDIGLRAIDFKFDSNINDINDLYLADLTALRKNIKESLTYKMEDNYILNDFIFNIKDNGNYKQLSTGFNKLDQLLNGGIYPGLYIVGAISSLGKTALILQIADNIAKDKNNVLFFSLEMPKDELISRSISRKLVSKDKNFGTNDILFNRIREDERKDFEKVLNSYAAEEGKYLKIIEHKLNDKDEYDIYIEDIITEVSNFINFTGKKPIVFIDYLQIIKPSKKLKFGTEKQCIDDIVGKLKKLSRKFKIPIIVISSFNRENYCKPVSFASFKESGSIEYTADFLIGLELAIDYGKNAVELLNKVNEMKKKDDRDIRLKVLKNRNGKSGTNLEFKFYARNNYFDIEENVYFNYSYDDKNKKIEDHEKEELKNINEMDKFVESIIDDFKQFTEFKTTSTKALKMNRLKKYLIEEAKTVYTSKFDMMLLVDKIAHKIKVDGKKNDIREKK
jgi:replicative DNA helicase